MLSNLKGSDEDAGDALVGTEGFRGWLLGGANRRWTANQIKAFVAVDDVFTPTLGDGTNNFSLTTADGSWSLIGNRVFGEFDCIWDNIGLAGAGTLRITLTGLPPVGQNAGFTFGRAAGLDTTATLNQIVGLLTKTLTTITFERINDNAAQTALPANGCSATGRIVGSFSYTIV